MQTIELWLQATRVADSEFQIVSEIGRHWCIRGFLSREWIPVFEGINVKKKSTEDIVSILLKWVWNFWRVSWHQQKDDIQGDTRYCIQVQDYNNTLKLKSIYECFRIMGKQDEQLLKTDVTLHLNETQYNITIVWQCTQKPKS